MGLAIAVAAGLAALALALLCVPVELRFRLDADERVQARGTLVWLFGLVRKELAGRDDTAPKPARRRGPKKRPSRRRRPLEPAARVLRVVRTPGLAPRTARTLRCLFRSVRWRRLRADLRIGLADPADTGDLFALVGPATVLLWRASGGRVSIQPAFADEAVVRGRAAGMLRIVPLRPLACALAFALSRPALRAAWRARRRR